MLINPIHFFQKLLILSCISIFCINYTNAQIAAPSTEYTVPKVYQIGDIKVIGNDRSDSKSIVTISGLRVGESIVIPGTDIQYAIDKLWQLKLFTKVDVFVTETIGEIINLEINVQERQKVAGFEILGVKKGYVDEITEEVEKIILPGTIITENLKVKASKIIEDYHKDKGYNNITVAVSEKVHPSAKVKYCPFVRSTLVSQLVPTNDIGTDVAPEVKLPSASTKSLTSCVPSFGKPLVPLLSAT